MKLFRPIGLELTYIPNEDEYFRKHTDEACRCLCRDYCSRMEDIFKIYSDKISPTAGDINSDPYQDEGAVEVPTSPTEYLEVLKYQYDYWYHIAKKLNMVTNTKYLCSGGMHINIGIKLEDRALITDMVLDMHNRPYLNWIFNEYNDIKSAEGILNNGSSFIRILEDAINGKRDFFRLYNLRKGCMVCINESYRHLIDDKFTSVHRPEYVNRLEWRIFNMADSWKECYHMIMFANRYTKYFLSRMRDVEVKVKCKNDIMKFTRNDKGIKEFKELLMILGLKYSNYQIFIDKNYMNRKELGCWIDNHIGDVTKKIKKKPTLKKKPDYLCVRNLLQ